MTRRIALSIVLGGLMVASSAAAQQALPTARLDSVFSRYATGATPGCAVGVASNADTVARAYGMSDLEHDVPLTASSILEAGSVAKQVTAAAVVLLALDGKLSLDDQVQKHVPELPDYGTPITLRHLLNHTSGLRDWGSMVALAGWPRGTRTYTNDIAVDVASRQKALNYPPGTYYSYTNTGYNLLAVIVARTSGQSFANFTRDRIFVPLGMSNSSWRDDYTRIVKGRAQAYSPAGNGWRLDMPFENAHGNGGLLTTVHDLLRFTDNLETGKVGGAKFVEEMHHQGRLLSGDTITYASGLMVTEWQGMKEVNHSGATAGYRAFLTRLPEHDLSVAVLCNASNANPTALARQVLQRTITIPRRVAAANRGTPVDSASMARMFGTYRNTRLGQPVQMAWRDGRVVVANGLTLSKLPDGRLVTQTGDVVLIDAPRPGQTRAGFSVLTRADSMRYEPVETFTPTAALAAEYAGRYESDEAEAAYDVVADGVYIRLRDRYGRLQPMRPAYRDSFSVGGTMVTFVRNAAGKITGMDIGSARAWAVRFDRK